MSAIGCIQCEMNKKKKIMGKKKKGKSIEREDFVSRSFTHARLLTPTRLPLRLSALFKYRFSMNKIWKLTKLQTQTEAITITVFFHHCASSVSSMNLLRGNYRTAFLFALSLFQWRLSNPIGPSISIKKLMVSGCTCFQVK